jgi:MinD-like ATPase involved in chromosome partitioning or flagellar assembly
MTIPRRSDAFVSRKLGEETIVVPVRAGVANLEAIFTMNAVGSTIWNRIDGHASLDDLTRAVQGEFAVTPEAAAADVAAFVELLAAKGLIVAAEAGP